MVAPLLTASSENWRSKFDSVSADQRRRCDCTRFAPGYLCRMQDSTPTRVRVAIVVASLRILGGQAVQAQRLIDRWRTDREVDAWIVPIDPVPAPPFDRLTRIKYVRTLVTQLW